MKKRKKPHNSLRKQKWEMIIPMPDGYPTVDEAEE